MAGGHSVEPRLVQVGYRLGGQIRLSRLARVPSSTTHAAVVNVSRVKPAAITLGLTKNRR
jgi:hypothetical protein